MSKFIRVIMLVVGVSIVYMGIRELDQADTWIEVFRGLFLTLVGASNVYIAKSYQKESKEG